MRTALLAAPDVGSLQKLRRETMLFQQQQPASGVFMIETGLVKLVRTSDNGGRLILTIAGPHQLVGEEALSAGQERYLTDIISLTEVSGFYIPLETIKRLFKAPELAAAIIAYAMQRDVDRVNRIELLTHYDVEHRILRGLAELAQMVEPNAEKTAFAIPVTQSEIADFVGATRETISSILSSLRERQLVSLGRRLVTTVHPDILLSAANDRLTRSHTF